MTSVARSFPPEPGSVPAARRLTVATVGDVAPGIADIAELLVSEMATNAVLYASTDFEVDISITEDGVRIAVTDGGAGDPRVQPTPPAESTHGRGLLIVEQLAEHWGVERNSSGIGKTVWASLSLH